MKTLILTLVAVLTLSCTSLPKDGVVTCEKSSKGEVKSSEVCKLGEEIEFISDINFFEILDENLFVAATSEQVYLYNMSGEQLCKIGSQGRARGEYLSPYMLASHNGNIFVGAFHKIIEYNQQGKTVQEYAINTKKRYSHIEVSEKYIFLHSPIGAGSDDESNFCVNIFDRASSEMVAQVAQYDEMDKVFSLSMVGNGLVSVDDKEVTLLQLSDLTLNKYNTATSEKEQLFDIDSPTYNLDTTVKYDEITNPSAIKQFIHFLENSSSPMCAGLHKNKLYVVTNESVTGDNLAELQFERHLLTIDTKQGKGEYREIEFTSGIVDKTYQFHDGQIYALTFINGEYYIRKMDI